MSKIKNFLHNYFTPLSKIEIIVGLYIFCLFASETMGFKTIQLFSIGDFPLNSSVAIFIMPFIFSINDMITEVYGIKKTLALSRLGFFVIILIMLYSLLFTNLPPAARFAPFNEAYNSVFGFSIRASIASLTAFAVSQIADIIIFRQIKSRLKHTGLWFRNNVSNIVGLLLDTVIFMLIARWNLELTFTENWQYLVSLILPYWLLKCSMSFLITPLTYAGVKWLRGGKLTEEETS